MKLSLILITVPLILAGLGPETTNEESQGRDAYILIPEEKEGGTLMRRSSSKKGLIMGLGAIGAATVIGLTVAGSQGAFSPHEASPSTPSSPVISYEFPPPLPEDSILVDGVATNNKMAAPDTAGSSNSNGNSDGGAQDDQPKVTTDSTGVYVNKPTYYFREEDVPSGCPNVQSRLTDWSDHKSACGTTYKDISRYGVAISPDLGDHCGDHIIATFGEKKVALTVVDVCPGCKQDNHLDMSLEALIELLGSESLACAINTVTPNIEWKFVSAEEASKVKNDKDVKDQSKSDDAQVQVSDAAQSGSGSVQASPAEVSTVQATPAEVSTTQASPAEVSTVQAPPAAASQVIPAPATSSQVIPAAAAAAAPSQASQQQQAAQSVSNGGGFSNKPTYYFRIADLPDPKCVPVQQRDVEFKDAFSACGQPFTQVSKYGVAIAGGKSHCGKQIVASYGGRSITLTVVDECPGCAGDNHLDMSIDALHELFGGDARLTCGIDTVTPNINWAFA